MRLSFNRLDLKLRHTFGLCEPLDRINIKLMTCGGLREAMRSIHAARQLGTKIMP